MWRSVAAPSLPQRGDGPGGRVRAPGRRGFRPPVSLRKLRPRGWARRVAGGSPRSRERSRRVPPPARTAGGWWGPGRARGVPGLRAAPPCPAWRVSRPGASAAGPAVVVEAAMLGVPRGQRSAAEPLGAAARRCARAPAFPAARPAPPAAPPRARRGEGGADRGRRRGRARTKVSPDALEVGLELV